MKQGICSSEGLITIEMGCVELMIIKDFLDQRRVIRRGVNNQYSGIKKLAMLANIMTVRIFTLGVVFLIVAVLTSVAEAGENKTVSFKPVWEVNDTATYTMTKSKTQNGKTQSVSSVITVTVIGKTSDSYIFEWRCEDFDTENNIPAEYKGTLTEVAKGIKFKYMTDKYGGYQKLVNLDEVRSGIKQFLAELLVRINDEKIRDLTSTYLSTLIQDDQFISLSARDIAYLHNSYFLGEVFDAGKTYEMEVSLPNPLNPVQPFAGIVEMTALCSGGFKEIVINQEIDKEKSAAILQDTLKKMSVTLAGRQLDDQFKITSLGLNDTFRYSIEESGNWVERGSITRTIVLNGSSRTETVEFIRKK